MPCDTRKRKPEQIKVATARLEKALAMGTVKVTVDGRTGAIAFTGWKEEDRDGMADVCAYRRLLSSGSSALRMAVSRAEALAGRKVSTQAVAAGVHSHDGGQTWGTH